MIKCHTPCQGVKQNHLRPLATIERERERERVINNTFTLPKKKFIRLNFCQKKKLALFLKVKSDKWQFSTRSRIFLP